QRGEQGQHRGLSVNLRSPLPYYPEQAHRYIHKPTVTA
ncbi:hypothetical protein LEMLEM_LOCUS23024, partial [Lemmus lemmus]